MSTPDILMPYSEQWASLICDQGGEPPQVSQGNRWPTRGEVIEAIQAEGLVAVAGDEEITIRPPDGAAEEVSALLREVVEVSWDEKGTLQPGERSSYLAIVRCQDWERVGQDNIGIFFEGYNLPLEVFLAHRLAQSCGQMTLYSCGGGIPVVVGPECDPGRLASLWLESDAEEDGTRVFYEQAYP